MPHACPTVRRAVLRLLVLGLFMQLALLPATVNAQTNEKYVVNKGDNLTIIAARYGVTISALTGANRIANANNIFVGQVLVIPRNQPAAAAQPASAPATTGLNAYVVQRGDTLSLIAERYDVSMRDLASLNQLSLMDYIFVGQNLKMPATASSIPTRASSVAIKDITYTVIPGDSLASIAATFGTSLVELQRVNGLPVPGLIYPGQVLRIPGANAVAAAPATAAPVKTAAPVPVATQPPATAAAPVLNTSRAGKWIDVNLSTQRLTAYDGAKQVYTSLASTGTSRYPTVTGTFNIYVKYGSQLMSGGTGRDYYYLPGVPYVMYFYQAYAIHGAYWHNNFGRQMSHGCVNLPTSASQWMYNWAPIGTPVYIHY